MQVSPKYRIPPPISPDIFEAMITEIAIQSLPGFDCQLVGSRGDKQHGIDIICTNPRSGQVGIQCKCYAKYNAKLGKIIEYDLISAKQFSTTYPLNEFWLAMTIKRTSWVQVEINKIVLRSELPFIFRMLFWEDIVSKLETFPEVFRKYYSDLFILDSPELLETIDPVDVPLLIDDEQPLSLLKQEALPMRCHPLRRRG